MDSDDAEYCQDEDNGQESFSDWGSEEDELQEELPATRSSSRKRKQTQRPAKRSAKKPRKAGPAPGGGTRSHGSNQRMWARYSEKMKETCPKCGNVPHDRKLQPTDAEAASFAETRCQGESAAQIVNAWQAKLSMHRTKEMKLTGSVEPKHTLVSPQQLGSASYLQKSFTFSLQPYQLAFVINHAVFEQKVEYDTNLFADAAMDIFHLRTTDNNSETKPAWLGYVTPGVDVDAAQLSLVQALGSKLQMWYEKHQMWELTKHHKPTTGEQPSQPGKFTDDYPAIKYVHEALTKLFQLSAAQTLGGLAESYPAEQWLLAINRGQARHTATPAVLLELVMAMEAVGYGNESWLVADMFQQLMLGPAPATSAAAADSSAAGSSNHAGSSSNSIQQSSPYADYWQALLQHLQQADSVEDGAFPALPGGRLHPVLWRLAAVALRKVIHVISADDNEPRMVVYPPSEVAFKLRTVDEDGKVHYKYTKGLTEPHWVVHLGIDPLPNTLKDGITFLDDGNGLLVPWEPDMDLTAKQLECGDYPAAFEVEIVDARRRIKQSAPGPVEAADRTVIDKALDLLRSGQGVCRLESDPFPPDRHIYLLDVLAKVTEVLDEQPFTAAKRVCEAFGVEVSARQGAAADSPAADFRNLLEKLLVAKSADILVQLAAALLPHVPDISPEDGAVEDIPGGDPMAQDADEDDWYLATIGPKADGSWGYVQFSTFVRLCDLVITSSRAEDFAWSAGGALIRLVGLHPTEVESREYATVDLATSLSLEQRLVNLALDVTQAKARVTMKGYFSYWQPHLALAWQNMHKQQQQQQQQQQQSGTAPGHQQQQQQSGQQTRRWPAKSCMVTVENFKRHLDQQEQPQTESRRLRAAFASVLSPAAGTLPDSGPGAEQTESTGQAVERQYATAFKADDLPEVRRVRETFCSPLVRVEDDIWRYRLSYTSFDKHVFASSWLQKHQHILVFGKLADDDALHKAPDVQVEDASRRKTENKRRSALNIAPANYRPRPELGGDAVSEKMVITALEGATTTAACKRVIGAIGRHLTGLSTLCRGKDVRNMLLPALGHLAYPLQRSLLPEQYVLKPGHTGRSYSMKCLSFTNTEGKTNPGDRVDMDVVVRTKNPLLDGTFWIFWQIFITFHVATFDVTIAESGEADIQEGLPQPDFSSQDWTHLYIWWDQDPHHPITSNAVLENLNQILQQAGVDTMKKQHFGRKFKILMLRTVFNTPLPDLDNIGRWATNVKDQYYAQLPGRDVVANIAGFQSADMYWIFRDDLNPEEIDEFKPMVNSVLPWLGRATAQAWQAFHKAPSGRKNYSATDTLAGLTHLRVWWLQTLPFLWDKFPTLPVWDWPVLSRLKSTGILQRWCDVVLTYHDLCVRATELASRPAAAMHFGQLGPPEQTIRLLSKHMEAFGDYVMHKGCDPSTNPDVTQMALRLGLKPQELVAKLDKALGRRQPPQQQRHQQQEGQAAQPSSGLPRADVHEGQQPELTEPAASAATDMPDHNQHQQRSTQRSDEQQVPAPQPAEVLFDIDAAADAEISLAAEVTQHYERLVLTEAEAEQYMSVGSLILQRCQVFDAADAPDGAGLSFGQYVAGLRKLGKLLSARLHKVQSMIRANQQLTAKVAAVQQQQGLQQQANHAQVLGILHQFGLRQKRMEDQQHDIKGMLAELLGNAKQQQQRTSHIGEGIDLLLLNGTTLQHSMTVTSQQVQHMHQDLASVSADQVRLAGMARASYTSAKKHRPAATSKHATKSGGRAAATGTSAASDLSTSSAAASKSSRSTVTPGQAATTGSAVGSATALQCAEWPGLITNATDMLTLKKEGCVVGISHAVSEWITGIQLPGTQPPQRTPPVKQLEADKLNARGDRRWRAGSKIRQVVAWKKHIWFAYERRTLGHLLSPGGSDTNSSNTCTDGGGGGGGGGGSSNSSSVLTRHEAVEDLEVLARLLHSGEPVGDVTSRKGKFRDLQQKQPNYEKLYKYLNTVEWPVATYEKQYWQEIYS